MTAAKPPTILPLQEGTPPALTMDCQRSAVPKRSVSAWEDQEAMAAWKEHTTMQCQDACVLAKTQKSRLPCITVLDDGTVHVCGGPIPCCDAEPNADSLFVCPHSGIAFEAEISAEFFDLNGGTERRTGDPDQACGDTRPKVCNKRRDAANASRHAFVRSSHFDDTVDPSTYATVLCTPPCKKAKRGALCVGEARSVNGTERNRSSGCTDLDLYLKERPRSSACLRGAREGRDADIPLYREASLVIGMFFQGKSTKPYAEDSQSRGTDAVFASNDFYECLQKHVIKQRMAGRVVTFDEAHNLCLHFERTQSSEKVQQADRERIRMHEAVAHTARYRNLLIAVCVSVWKACCRTPYLRNNRSGQGPGRPATENSRLGGPPCSFRPLIAGILYAMQRGVTLPCGLRLLPACKSMETLLPMLRSKACGLGVQSLHSSSHRGIGIFSRCIASVPVDKQQEVFQNAIRCCASFEKARFSSTDV